MQGESCVHGGLLDHVGVAEGILVAEEGIVAVVVNNEKTGAWSYLDQVYTGLEVEAQDNILGLLGEGGIHRSLAVVAVVAVAVVGLGGTMVEVRHSNHLQPYCFCRVGFKYRLW